MDPLIAMQETQYNNGPRTYKKPFLNFLDRLSFSITIVIFCVIVIFSPLWLQVVSRLLFTIPRVIIYILNPKVVFVLTNVIVITLIGESRIYSSRSSLPTSELRKDLIVLSHFCDLWSHGNVRVEMGYQRFSKENIDRPMLEEGKRCKFSPLQMDSLNQRADDLIARVNRQRRLETGLLLSP